MKTKPNLSTEYPKWLYKRGERDLMVQNTAQEEEQRGKGYSHEYVASDAPAAWQEVPADKGTPGTVPTAVMDAELASLKERFDRAWNAKCAELSDLKADHEKEVSSLRDAAVEYGKVKTDYERLSHEHKKLLTEYNAMLAAERAMQETKKPGPIKPPVAKAEA